MRTLITTLPLGSLDVEVYSDTELSALTDAEGCFIPDPAGYMILLDANLEPSLAGQVFVHELLEAACAMAEVDLPHPQLQTLSVFLAQMLGVQIDFSELEDELEVESEDN